MRSESTHQQPTRERHYSITPTLFVGPSPTPRAVEVKNARAAVKVIKQGGIAVLPAGKWREAEKALSVLTSSKEVARERVAVVKAGRLL